MKKIVFLTASLLITAGSLQAATITNTVTVTMGTEQDVTASLVKFDPSFGTLTGVYLEYVTRISGAFVQIDNDAGYAQQGRAIAQSSVNAFSTSVRRDGTGIGDADGRLNLYKSKLFSSIGATSGDEIGVFNITGQSDYTNWNSGVVSSTLSGYVDSSVFADYIGDGTFDSYINSTITASASVGSTMYYAGNSPSGEFSAKVIYEYSPIPEPASASLATLVIVAAIWIRRRFID